MIALIALAVVIVIYFLRNPLMAFLLPRYCLRALMLRELQSRNISLPYGCVHELVDDVVDTINTSREATRATGMQPMTRIAQNSRGEVVQVVPSKAEAYMEQVYYTVAQISDYMDGRPSNGLFGDDTTMELLKKYEVVRCS